jgi:G3E family GTPase
MRSKLRVVTVRRDKTIELPDNVIPIRLEQIIEPTGLANPAPSSDKFVLYYLEKEER